MSFFLKLSLCFAVLFFIKTRADLPETPQPVQSAEKPTEKLTEKLTKKLTERKNRLLTLQRKNQLYLEKIGSSDFSKQIKLKSNLMIISTELQNIDDELELLQEKKTGTEIPLKVSKP